MSRRSPATRPKQAPRAPERHSKKISKKLPRTPALGRDVTGKFAKGFSGNPNGRTVIVPEEIRELARQHSKEAIEKLVHWMRCDDPQASLAAIKLLLDRGLGKAVQPLIGTGASLVNINLQAGATISSTEDLAAVYAEIIGNPSIDIAALRIEAPASSARVDKPARPDPVLDRETPLDRKRATWAKLGT